MIYNPKTVVGDIIASVDGKKCTVEELILRFNNNENGLLQQCVIETVNHLVKKEMLHEDRKGVLQCNASGRDYLKRHGYYD